MGLMAADPVEAHVYGFGAFGGDGTVCDLSGVRVVRLEG